MIKDEKTKNIKYSYSKKRSNPRIFEDLVASHSLSLSIYIYIYIRLD